MVGSLDHTSPLSNSLASSESLSISLRSVTEFRNLHPLVAATQQTADVTKSTNVAGPSSAASGSGTSRQPVSEDIPVPAMSQYPHHQHHHHHHHQQQSHHPK